MLEDKILKLEKATELGIRPSQVKDTADTNGYATEIQLLRKEVETYKEMVEELIALVDELKSQKDSGIRLYSLEYKPMLSFASIPALYASALVSILSCSICLSLPVL